MLFLLGIKGTSFLPGVFSILGMETIDEAFNTVYWSCIDGNCPDTRCFHASSSGVGGYC